MASARASVLVDGPRSRAAALWLDPHRWPGFVDGFARLRAIDESWPQEGARVRWESTPGGRGEVRERVLAHEPAARHRLEVQDPRITGTQEVRFIDSDEDDGRVRVELEIEWRLTDRNPLSPLLDVLFIRRAFRDSLRHTLHRFARELAADALRADADADAGSTDDAAAAPGEHD